MAIPILQTNAVSNLTSNETSLVCTEPSGIVDNDIIVIICAHDGGIANIASSGFTFVARRLEGNVTISYLQKRASSESGTYTVTWSTNQQCRIMIIRVSGCVTTADPIEVIGIQQPESGSTTNACPAITTLSNDTLAVCALACDRDRVDSADGFSIANGFTKEGVSGSSGGANGAGLIVGEKDIATEGGTLSPTFGTWVSDQNISLMFNMKSIEPPTVVVQQPLIVNQSLTI